MRILIIMGLKGICLRMMKTLKVKEMEKIMEKRNQMISEEGDVARVIRIYMIQCEIYTYILKCCYVFV